jgi:hypothetical protein
MARSREEVYSLFGIKSPAQVMAERRAAQMAEADALSGAGQAGYGLGTMFGRALGFTTPEEQQSAQMAEAIQGVDPTNPEQLRNLAKTVSSFAPEAALRMLTEAKALETPTYQNISVQVMEPEFDALGRKVGETPKSIQRTGVFVGGNLTGYVDGQGNVTPLAATTTTGVMDSPEAKASREQATATDLGGGAKVTLKTDGKTPVTQDQIDAAKAGPDVTMNVTPEAAQRIEMQQGPRGSYGPAMPETVEQRAPIAPVPTITSEDMPSTFTETPLQGRDRAMSQLGNEDNAKLLRMKQALEAQPTLTYQDQELLRMITSELADRRRAPEQKQR